VRRILRWIKFLWWRMTGQFPNWRKLGQFSGEINLLYRSPVEFGFIFNPENPFRFERGTEPDKFVPSGEIIQPGNMETDGGSIPRVAELGGLNRLTDFPGYLIHDWEFDRHHAGEATKGLDEVNLTLCEAVYTLMMTGAAPMNGLHLRLIWDGVSSPIGHDVWDGSWLKK